MVPTEWHSVLSKTMEIVKRSVVVRGLTGEGREAGTNRWNTGFLRQQTTLCDPVNDE